MAGKQGGLGGTPAWKPNDSTRGRVLQLEEHRGLYSLGPHLPGGPS